MVYNTQLPIDIIFNAVEDYVDFADLANQTLTSRPRNKTDGLWDIVLPLPTTSATPVEARANLQINAIICKDTSKTQLVTYLYGCCCSPKTSTWKKAIKN